MKPDRMRRVDEAVREVLADVLQNEMKDPRIGFATVTGVRTSTDLSHATVLVSVLELEGGSGHSAEDTLEGLRSAHGFLQRRVGEELRLKHTPLLKFTLDETVDRAMRIQELLDHPPAPPVETPEEGADAASADGEDASPTQDDAPR
ncbi:30S ribosome-binding factor RbfA [Patulibacter sp. SYSU D01012]|uniref:30S ribosome-binding factor RbfA n=1 Tax=Patulibacter sp. SYSU D01012 TaxID=2817381 RepID=UPI001FEF21ED|nr:30S ribosome-binding factor RbfA [Patulibacter sp. SYSU D01012]